MSTFFPESERSLVERMVIRLLKLGEVPKHIAFIMDGNRRYAQKRNVQKIVGHTHGFNKLAETLMWCKDLGITQTTLYAFSIENFKRPKNEVDGLFDLFRVQFEKIEQEYDKFDESEICVRVYGKLDLMPLDIQQSVAKVVLRTSKHSKFYLNVCFSYTAREEINNAMNDLNECVAHDIIRPEDINFRTLNNAMYSLGLSDPDILVRTSGEIRLSDYLLWQTSHSLLYFVDGYWPDFTIWNLFAAVLHYQLDHSSMQRSHDEYINYLVAQDIEQCRRHFHKSFHQSSDEFDLAFSDYLSLRDERIRNCQEWILNKRLDHLKSLLKQTDCNNDEQLDRRQPVSSDRLVNNNPTSDVHFSKIFSDNVDSGFGEDYVSGKANAIEIVKQAVQNGHLKNL